MNKRSVNNGFLDVLIHNKWLIHPVFPILLSLIAASAILLIMGKNPIVAFTSFLQGSGFLPKASYASGRNILTDFISFLGILAPMIFASLSVIVGLKAGLFNIGVSGQMLASGFLATSLIGYSELEACIAKPLVILIGIFVGGLLGMMVGFLKYKFNINEVVSTIMLNYIISFITGFFINTYYADSITRTSKIISAASCLTIKNIEVYGCKLNIPIGIFIALAAVFVTRFLLDRTVFGFELKAVGSNRYCAKYAGMNVGRNMVLTMALSGTLAGLAGVTYYLGYYNTIVPKSLANLGYDAIAVALLGNTSPVGSIFASVLITIFQKGSIYMNSIIGVPKEISSLIVGILLLFSACSGYFQYKVHRNYMKKTGKEGSR